MKKSAGTLPSAAIVLLLSAGSTFARAEDARPPPRESDPPGCAIEAERRRCASASGNAADMQACHEPALQGAQKELRRVLDAIGPGIEQEPALLDALAAAQMAWQSWLQRDCDAVSADYAGAALQSAMVTACLYEHTLARAQTLWQRHAAPEAMQIPPGCLPGR